VGEFITVYLGEMIPLKYHFKNIVAIQPKQKFGGFHDEYWFAYQINHRSGDVPNCKIKKLELLGQLKNWTWR
jgi:hypothetical protein